MYDFYLTCTKRMEGEDVVEKPDIKNNNNKK